MTKRIFALFLLALVASSTAVAEPRAVINFADLGGIDDWRPDGNDAIFVQGRQGKWYRATFFSSCFGLPFAETIAFITEPDGSLDKFSSILVDGQRCHFRTFERAAGPPAKRAKKRTAPDATDAS